MRKNAKRKECTTNGRGMSRRNTVSYRETLRDSGEMEKDSMQDSLTGDGDGAIVISGGKGAPS
jgi:hypothetical protein